MAPDVSTPSGYTFKPSRYSSHSLLLGSLPREGMGRRVLDVGCASGYLAEILVRRGYEVVGLERAGASGSDFPASVKLVEADLDEGIPSLSGEFSYVVCGDILEHVRHPARLLRELWTLLATDGRLVASLPNSGHLFFRLTALSGRFPHEERGLFDKTHIHFYTRAGWIDLLRSAGFGIEKMRSTIPPFGLAFPRLDGTVAIPTLEFFAHLSTLVWPTLFAYQFVAIAKPEAAPR